MELKSLKGTIIGVVQNKIKTTEYNNELVKDIIKNKPKESLKMVGLPVEYLEYQYSDLSLSEKSKINLAKSLKDDVIIVYNLTLGLTKKQIDTYKILLKKISTYNKKIILVDNNSYLFLNLVDNIYVFDNDNITYHTTDLFDKNLTNYIDVPKIVEFNHASSNLGVNLNHYDDFDELLKAIYRIKS